LRVCVPSPRGWAARQTLTRKLVHIISGTGFVLTWLLFRRGRVRAVAAALASAHR
jgi:hypothetical protein